MICCKLGKIFVTWWHKVFQVFMQTLISELLVKWSIFVLVLKVQCKQSPVPAVSSHLMSNVNIHQYSQRAGTQCAMVNIHNKLVFAVWCKHSPAFPTSDAENDVRMQTLTGAHSVHIWTVCLRCAGTWCEYAGWRELGTSYHRMGICSDSLKHAHHT